jgi:hypothetical protein
MKQINEKDTISILTQKSSEIENGKKQILGLGGLSRTIEIESTSVKISEFKENIKDFTEKLTDIMDSIPNKSKTFEVDTIEFNLSVNGAGKISFIGEVSAGFQAGMSITLKRKNTDAR